MPTVIEGEFFSETPTLTCECLESINHFEVDPRFAYLSPIPFVSTSLSISNTSIGPHLGIDHFVS